MTEIRVLPPRRTFKSQRVAVFRELARAEGYVMAREEGEPPWVFEEEEWEAMPRAGDESR